MALDKQVHIYSVDTSAFYDSKEKKIHRELCRLKADVSRAENALEKLRKYKRKLLKSRLSEIDDDFSSKYERFCHLYDRYENILVNRLEDRKEICKTGCTKLSKQLVNHFYIRGLTAKHYGYTYYRNINKYDLRDKNVISIFDSSLTRILGMNDREKIYTDIIIVRVYYFEILKSLIDNGFNLNGEKYVYFTSSAGQIRTKKAVFVKEKLLKRHMNTLTCGLTLDMINEKGGMNVNKYLSYMALISSATELWHEFDIDKSIVVDDFEGVFNDWVDYIDYNTYEITRQKMDVAIPHTDGAGIMLDGNNTMVRIPFVKGLMVKTPFDTFIRQYKKKGKKWFVCHGYDYDNFGKVKDIYGKEYDILAEDIRYIFTKSQFKMWKYFDSWDQYKSNFKKYHCEACKCNEEEDLIPNAKLNYQMLQTLSDMSENELRDLCKGTNDEIKDMCTDRKRMLEVLGITDENKSNMSYLQKCLTVYPELLKDPYLRETIKQTKASIVKDAKSGKIKINGKYTFVCPDVYAFMEWLFLGEENPQGLLNTGEVYCNLFDDGVDLACLRSPHLYHEWAVRKNTYFKGRKTNNQIEMSKWLKGKAIYTSTRDLISKILQFDVDGDHLLVVNDDKLIKIANRNRKTYDFVPLYYEMKKADAKPITNDEIYSGLVAAFTGGNIGIISNNISKMWNMIKPINREMTADECREAFEYNLKTIKAIKLMCMENNFTIDYAKTLFKPTRPKEIDDLISEYTKLKLPYFFKYAKDKDDDQVLDRNNSVVNMLDYVIEDRKIKFLATNLGNFDYTLLMSNPDIKINDALIAEYKYISTHKNILVREEYQRKNKGYYINTYIKKRLRKCGGSDVDITDNLVKYLFETKAICKNTLFNSFGDIVYENLLRNVDTKTKLCVCCGKRFTPNANNQMTCSKKCSRIMDNRARTARRKRSLVRN